MPTPELPSPCPKCKEVGYWHQEIELVGDGDYPDEIHIWHTCETGMSSADVYERMAAAAHGSESKAEPICGYETPRVVYKPEKAVIEKQGDEDAEDCDSGST